MVHPARVLWKLSQSGSLALSLAVLALPAAAAEPDRNLAAVESQAAGVVRIARRPARPATPASTATSAQFTNSAAQPDLQPRGQQSQTAQTSRPQQTRLQPAMSQPPVDQRSTSTIQQVGHAQPAPDCPPFTIVPCPVEPRWAAPSANPNAPGMLGCRCESTVLSEKYPDEYLCDGGDRDRPVHYESYTRQGLDTEDTVAEFTDHTGKERMRPSNRVCLYAPRFSTIRTVSRPHEGMNLNEIAKVGQSVGTDQFHTRLKLTHHVKNEMTGRVAVRSRASGLDSEQIQGNVSEAKPLVIHEKLLNVYQNLSFVRLGKLEKTDAALLNYGLKASLVWTREEYPVIAAKTDAAMVGDHQAHAATIVLVDEGTSKPGDLRVVKLADKDTAQPGEQVEFTIRYDNTGENTVYHVRIVDNLTPRLAYVDDSATSDREGRLVVQDNDEGSLVLIWELTNPLPPKTGGVVTFKARIR